jgi:GDP/UDP-N,N'-diacetylbacillosamine 2-epimerase (hydrolysing)
MTINIAFFTTTRAEFGLFIPLLRAIENSTLLKYDLFVGGTHFKKSHGETIKEIKEKGFKITDIFDYLGNGDSAFNLTKSVGRATQQLANIFNNYKIDFVCVLGDRYELLSIVQTAIIFRKPIIHIHGGEATHGAIDEQIRHMITKAAHIHFVACNDYYQNVCNMGEQEWRIFNTGALAVDNIQSLTNIDKNSLFKEFGLIENRKTALMTYHPVTLEMQLSPKQQLENLFDVMGDFDLQMLITAPNIDTESEDIRKAINNRIDNKKYFFTESLGADKYLSMLHYVDFVIGNSSSGLLEVPYFKIPTINIGSRQDGRLRHESIIDADYEKESIKIAIEKALNPDYRSSLKNMIYCFGNGNSAQKMVTAIEKVAYRKDLMIKKLDFPC